MTFMEQPYEVAASRRGSREAKRIVAPGRPQAQQCDGLTAPARESRDGSTLGAARRRGEAEPSALLGQRGKEFRNGVSRPGASRLGASRISEMGNDGVDNGATGNDEVGNSEISNSGMRNDGPRNCSTQSASSHKGGKPAKRRGAGRPPVLSPEEIGRAALAMGLEGLTFLALSKRLGVSQATLYRYAPAKDDVLQLALEVGLAGFELDVRADDSWRLLFTRTVDQVWDVLGAMPGAADAISRGVVCAKLVRSSRMLADALAVRGFSVADAAFAVDMVFDIVLDQRRGTDMLDLGHCANGDVHAQGECFSRDGLRSVTGAHDGDRASVHDDANSDGVDRRDSSVQKDARLSEAYKVAGASSSKQYAADDDAENAWASRHVDRERFKADWAKMGRPDTLVIFHSVPSHSVVSHSTTEHSAASSRSAESRPVELQSGEALSVSSPSAPSTAAASQALIAADQRAVMLRKVDIALAGFEGSGMIRSS